MKSKYRKFILQNIGKKSVREIARELEIKEKKVEEFLRQHDIDTKRAARHDRAKIAVDKKFILLSAFLIIVLGFIAYSGSFNGQFIFDDLTLVKNNYFIKNWSEFGNILSGNLTGELKKLYRPVQLFTYAVDYSVWRLNVTGYHLTNVILHILVALAVYFLINILFKDNILSLFTGTLFVVHPIHSEAIYYISGRAEPLGLLFMLICFITYLRNARGIGAYLILISSYALALLSKESSIILPALILVYHGVFREKVRVKEFGSLLAISVIYIILRTTVFKSPVSNISESYTLFQRMPWFFAAVSDYLRLLFLPFNLHMEYGFGFFTFASPKAVIGIFITLALLLYAFLKNKSRDSVSSFSILWFFVALVPFSGIYPINAYMAEHWLYIPSVGFFLLIAGWVSAVYKKKELRIVAIAFLAILLIFFTYLTKKQADYWKDETSFYTRTLKYSPGSVRLLNNMANESKPEEAIELYKKAIALDKKHISAYVNMGIAYETIGKHDEAIDAYNNALAINPNYSDAYNNLGSVYLKTGKKEDALAMFKKAVELEPTFHEALSNLGMMYELAGNHKDAIAAYRKAIEYSPDNPAYYAKIAVVFYNDGQYRPAVEYSDKAVRLGYKMDPGFLKLLEPYRNSKP